MVTITIAQLRLNLLTGGQKVTQSKNSNVVVDDIVTPKNLVYNLVDYVIMTSQVSCKVVDIGLE